MVLFTLREMAKGGMNDQLGGGFHRYSVDARWFVPHFEKMLYDQAQLADLVSGGISDLGRRGSRMWRADIFEYVLRDMTDPGGGFYSAEDADSVIDPANPQEKGEGAFYIWTRAEIDEVLWVSLPPMVLLAYGVEPDGNVSEDPHGEFTGKNILYQKLHRGDRPASFNVSEEEVQRGSGGRGAKLLAVAGSESGRIWTTRFSPPGTD